MGPLPPWQQWILTEVCMLSFDNIYVKEGDATKRLLQLLPVVFKCRVKTWV